MGKTSASALSFKMALSLLALGFLAVLLFSGDVEGHKKKYKHRGGGHRDRGGYNGGGSYYTGNGNYGGYPSYGGYNNHYGGRPNGGGYYGRGG